MTPRPTRCGVFRFASLRGNSLVNSPAPGQGEAGQGEAGQGEARRGEAGQGRAGHKKGNRRARQRHNGIRRTPAKMPASRPGSPMADHMPRHRARRQGIASQRSPNGTSMAARSPAAPQAGLPKSVDNRLKPAFFAAFPRTRPDVPAGSALTHFARTRSLNTGNWPLGPRSKAVQPFICSNPRCHFSNVSGISWA
jgi:hypothetical protein